MTEEKNPLGLVDALRNMEIGDSLEFPAEVANSTRATASAYGFQWGRIYTTKTDRNHRIVIVTRKS